MKPIEALGLGPTYKCVKAGAQWEVTVTPPSFVGLPPNTVTLSEKQYAGFLAWRRGNVLIQDALPEVSAAEREVLMTGIGNEDFQQICAEEEEGPCTGECSESYGKQWVCTGTQYGGDDERWDGEGRCYCMFCGADGDG